MKARSVTVHLFGLVLIIAGWHPDLSSATIIEVPADHPTIAGAIQAATHGDTMGKAITISGHYHPGGDWELVEQTVIDGGNTPSSVAASTVTIQSQEDRSTMIQGLTITGGTGSQWVDPQFPAYTWHGGGGVFVFQSSPMIRYCIVAGNSVVNDGRVDGAQGGGILTCAGFPLVYNTIIDSNQAEYGDGLVVDYSGAEVRNVIISRN